MTEGIQMYRGVGSRYVPACKGKAHAQIRFPWNEQLARSLACSFVRSYVRSFVCSFVRSFVCSYVRSYVRMFVCSYVRSFVRMFLRSRLERRVSKFLSLFSSSLYSLSALFCLNFYYLSARLPRISFSSST